MRKQSKDYVLKLVRLGLLAAMSLLLVYLIRFPIFPAASFLEYDMADVPILIGTFLYGPAAGLVLTLVVSVLQWLLVSPASGWIGAAMHFFATGAFVLVAGNLYQRHRTLKGAVVSLVLGAVTMIAMMIPLNLIFTGHFMGTPMDVVWSMMFPVIVPFNAIKAFGNGALTFLLYKAVGRALRLGELPEKKREENAPAQNMN